MKKTDSLSMQIRDGNVLAAKIHSTAKTLTLLIQEARKNNIIVRLDNASGYSASNGCEIDAEITATVVFGATGPKLS